VSTSQRMGWRAIASRLVGLRALPGRVAAFQGRALVRALRLGDRFALEAAMRPDDLRRLVDLAAGRQQVVELGTACGWTAGALALANASRVVSFDPVRHEHRDEYVALLSERARRRIEFVQESGAAGAARPDLQPDLLIVDSTHSFEGTVEEVDAWRRRLVPGAVVAFHDYDHPAFPGVREAIEHCGLTGERAGGFFLWRP
jgi:predicted O-methyltransferase YrrM